jgi:hypothetical protein
MNPYLMQKLADQHQASMRSAAAADRLIRQAWRACAGRVSPRDAARLLRTVPQPRRPEEPAIPGTGR